MQDYANEIYPGENFDRIGRKIQEIHQQQPREIKNRFLNPTPSVSARQSATKVPSSFNNRQSLPASTRNATGHRQGFSKKFYPEQLDLPLPSQSNDGGSCRCRRRRRCSCCCRRWRWSRCSCCCCCGACARPPGPSLISHCT